GIVFRWHQACSREGSRTPAPGGRAAPPSGPRDTVMLPLRFLRALSRFLPEIAPGGVLHRRALAAQASGAWPGAVLWSGAAPERSRRELEIGALARLRVHQLMAQAEAGGLGAGEAAIMLEIVRRLTRLDRLETLQPPFELADARTVLARWL